MRTKIIIATLLSFVVLNTSSAYAMQKKFHCPNPEHNKLMSELFALEEMEAAQGLFLACTSGDSEAAASHVRMIENINQYVNADGFSFLDVASRNGHRDIMRLIGKRGGLFTKKASDFYAPPLHRVIADADITKIESLFESDNHIDIGANGLRGSTALHEACETGKLEIVQFFLDRNADVNAENYLQFTPLHIACTGGFLDIAKLLVECGAHLERKNCQDATALYFACHFQHTNTLEFLVNNGANINAVCRSQNRPLHVAASLGLEDILKFLLSLEKIEIDAKNAVGETALHQACRENKYESVKILLTAGADKNAKDKDDRTPLHIASYTGSLAIVELLLQHGADVNAIESFQNKTPLYYAASEEIANLLRSHGGE